MGAKEAEKPVSRLWEGFYGKSLHSLQFCYKHGALLAFLRHLIYTEKQKIRVSIPETFAGKGRTP